MQSGNAEIQSLSSSPSTEQSQPGASNEKPSMKPSEKNKKRKLNTIVSTSQPEETKEDKNEDRKAKKLKRQVSDLRLELKTTERKYKKKANLNKQLQSQLKKLNKEKEALLSHHMSQVIGLAEQKKELETEKSRLVTEKDNLSAEKATLAAINKKLHSALVASRASHANRGFNIAEMQSLMNAALVSRNEFMQKCSDLQVSLDATILQSQSSGQIYRSQLSISHDRIKSLESNLLNLQSQLSRMEYERSLNRVESPEVQVNNSTATMNYRATSSLTLNSMFHHSKQISRSLQLTITGEANNTTVMGYTPRNSG